MIPRDVQESINRYVAHGVPTGDFLYAVLSNDLFEAMSKADDNNRLALWDICNYIYNSIPSTCWGSPLIVKQWLQSHRERLEKITVQEGEPNG